MLYKIADVVFDINCYYPYSKRLLDLFKIDDGKVDCAISYGQSEIDDIIKYFNFDNRQYAESILILKLVAEFITKNKDGLFYHSSSFSYKGQGVLIAADSGTGKSTHSRFWRQLYGDDVVMINDDKPFLRRVDGKIYIYGSPWMGKHNLGCNDKVQLKAVCLLRRADCNSVVKIEKGDLVGEFLNHALRISTPETTEKILDFCQFLFDNCDFYILNAKFDVSAAKVCHDTLFGEL